MNPIDDLTEPEMREELAALRLKIAKQGYLSIQEYDRAYALFHALGEFDELYRRLDGMDRRRLLRIVRERAEQTDGV